jgi:hypothetical protein
VLLTVESTDAHWAVLKGEMSAARSVASKAETMVVPRAHWTVASLAEKMADHSVVE